MDADLSMNDLRARLARSYRDDRGFVLRSLRVLGVHARDVEDATQEVYTQAWSRIGEFEGRSVLRTWLFSIARKVASNLERMDGRHERRVEASSVRAAGDVSGGDRAMVEFASLFQSVSSMPDSQADAFTLVDIEGLSEGEASKVLGVTMYSLRKNLASARQAAHAC